MMLKKGGVRLFGSGLGMTMRTMKALAAATVLWSGFSIAATQSGERPNILLILLDDLGYSDIGAYGSEIDTPNIDAIANLGLKFSNASVLPTCAPTRAALMTGQDPHMVGLGSQNKIFPPGASESDFGYKGSLEGDFQGIASILKEAGYSTMMAGKWHLGDGEEQLPEALGFEQSVILLDGAASHYNDGVGVAPVDTASGDGFATYLENGKPISQLPPDFYSTRFYTDQLLQMLESGINKRAPFFAFLSYTAVHDPLQAPEEYIEKYMPRYDGLSYMELRNNRIRGLCEQGLIKDCSPSIRWLEKTPEWDELSKAQQYDLQRRMATYAAMLDYTDHEIGRLVQYLKDTGQYDNTLILILSDNGAAPVPATFYARGAEGLQWQRENYPRRSVSDYGKKGAFATMGMPNAQASSAVYFGFKTTLFEGGVRTPLIIKRPGIHANGLSHTSVFLTDLYPTLADYAGVSVEGWPGIFGHSLKPHLDGRTDGLGEREYGMAWMGMRAYRQGDWKVVFVPKGYGGAGRYALYNLASDPGEVKDLSLTYPEKLNELTVKWDEYAEKNNVKKSPVDEVNQIFDRVSVSMLGIDWGE